jgi:hypothetical protein
MLDVAQTEIAKHLKKLSLVSLLADLADTREERAWYSAKYVEEVKWLEERRVPFVFDRVANRYVELEQE